MATNPIQIARTLPAIVCDLATTRQRLDALMARTTGRDPDEDEDNLWDELDERKDALDREFQVAFYQATGVAWTLASQVMG